MAAVYPYQYKSFTTHRNLLDDVDASHVNGLQDEVVAIQQTLGLTPNLDKSLAMRTNTWSSVGARMDAIQRGQGVPAIYLLKPSDSYNPTPVGGRTKWISFSAPSPMNDPEGLFNGHSITTNRSGWWIVFGRAVWGVQYPPQGDDRELSIAVNGGQVMTIDSPPGSDGNTHMSIGWQGPVSAGKTIDLGVYHPVANKTYSMSYLQLSACMIREM